jgi:DNA modification methylase
VARLGDSAGLADLLSSGLGVESLGELSKWKTIGAADPDAVRSTDPSGHQIVRRGDVWLLGDHRLMCGDSTSQRDVAKLLGRARPHLMVTDPPYGVSYDPNWRNEAARTSVGMGNRKLGAGAVGKVTNDNRADWRAAWRLFPGDVAYVWHGALHAGEVEASLVAAGFAVRSQIIWDKTRMIIGRGNYHWSHEPCWYAVRQGATAHWSGDHSQTTMWRIQQMRIESGHGTQKPVECMRRPIINNSQPGDAVYEPFCGSGTTIIAAEAEGRRCYAMELDPRYVYISVLRWQDYTGKEARLDGSGTFPEVLAARGAETPPEEAPAKPARARLALSSDPCLAELAYRRYAPPRARVRDPWPDPVRAGVACAMGLDYNGTTPADLLFMCPRMDDDGTPGWYARWLGEFTTDVRANLQFLADDRLSVAIAPDKRWSADNCWYGFPGHCVEAFAEAGARLYEERVVQDGRNMLKLLIFAKGDAKKAAALAH